MEKTKQAVKSLLKLKDKVAEAWEDQKITFFESLGIGRNSLPLLAIIQDLPEIGAEIKKATPKDLQNLVEEFKADFEISDDELEMKIEAAIQAMLNMYILFIPKDATN